MTKENNEFRYETTLKHRADDTFLNFQHYLLITSKQITKFLFHTSVTPHQVILFSLLIGVLSSLLIINDNKIAVVIGAVLLFYKNVLDKVDGSLARSKNMASRRGRFYDSISDFIVSFFLFTAIGWKLNQNYNSIWVWIVCFAALISSMLQCSFFIYYEVAFIKQTGKNTINRLLETVTEDDLKKEDKFTILLQRVFQIIYGWQDKFVYKIDVFLLKSVENKYFISKGEEIKNEISNIKNLWYKDKSFLSLSSLLGIGMHIVLIALFAVIGKFEYYLVLNLILWNLLLISAVIYHYFHTLSLLKPKKLNMVYITRKFHFSAAHRMYKPELSDEENFKLYGKCSNPNWHGHNYVLEVTVAGEPEPEIGYVMDLKKLRDIVDEAIIEKVDHKNINIDVGFMKGIIPTTENIVVQFWKQLENKINNYNRKLYSVKLSETENNAVEYRG